MKNHYYLIELISGTEVKINSLDELKMYSKDTIVKITECFVYPLTLAKFMTQESK